MFTTLNITHWRLNVENRFTSSPPFLLPVMHARPYSVINSFVRSVLDSEFDDLETPPRYRPESVQYFCRTTGFTESEIKKIYRNFKTECPTGLIKEDAFRGIYSQFFPQGGKHPGYKPRSRLLRNSLVTIMSLLFFFHVICHRSQH